MVIIEIRKNAIKQLAKIPLPDRERIASAIDGPGQWPEVRHVKSLTDREEYRLRVGRYRVIFTVDTQLIPTVISIEEVKKRDERTY